VSFRLRLALFGAALVAATLLAFGWLVYTLVTNSQGTTQDDALKQRAVDAVGLIAGAPAGELDGSTLPSLSGAEDLREQLARELAADKISEAQSLDLLLAATEVANNAIQYGGGIREVRVGRARGRFVCEIVDRGDGFDDPAAGYLAPREGIGAGLWVARQLTWRIEFFHSPAGFTTRIWL